MLPTPSTSHVEFDTIYEPAEDSFLFLDTLSATSESAWLQSRFPVQSAPPLVVEVGPGSGVVLAFVSAHATSIFGHCSILSLGVDVNPNACDATIQTVTRAMTDLGSHAVFLGCVQGSLCTPLKSRSVDVLIFNPPYVPTEGVPSLTAVDDLESSQFERGSHLLSLSYAGGKDGMEVTWQLLAHLPDVLSMRGVAYILFCRQNKPDEVKMNITSWQGGQNEFGQQWKWSAETVGESGKRAGWEKLEIVRIWRSIT